MKQLTSKKFTQQIFMNDNFSKFTFQKQKLIYYLFINWCIASEAKNIILIMLGTFNN